MSCNWGAQPLAYYDLSSFRGVACIGLTGHAEKEESVSSLGTASENTEPVIVSKEEASKKAMVSGASGMNFGGNGCNFTIKITFGQ
jgi:hypothetical protein